MYTTTAHVTYLEKKVRLAPHVIHTMSVLRRRSDRRKTNSRFITYIELLATGTMCPDQVLGGIRMLYAREPSPMEKA